MTMTRAAGDLVPDAERFARVLPSGASRATRCSRLVMRLTGMEGKLNQYAAGERFIAAVEAAGGPRAVDVVLDGAGERCRRWTRSATAAVARAGSERSLLDAVAGLTSHAARPLHVPAAGTVVTCAVSGGADSSALLVLGVAAGCAVTAVHVDHGFAPGPATEARRGRRCRTVRRRVPLVPVDVARRARTWRPGRAAPLRVAAGPTCSPGTPPTTRPRRC